MDDFNYELSSVSAFGTLNTSDFFDTNHIHSENSAIEDFIEKRIALFKLIKPYESDIDSLPVELSNMLILGFVSAVESYLRKVLRQIIVNDPIATRKSENQLIKYGAVLSQNDVNLLPEAIMEEYSFTNGKNIKESIKTLTGISIVDKDTILNNSLCEFSKVCQLRHCVVHRFNLLGSNNAISLGLNEHKRYIESSISINFDQLNEIVMVCDNTVKAINNYLFSKIMQRTYSDRIVNWTNDFRTDKKKFMKYYNIFKDSRNTTECKVIYREFIIKMHERYGDRY